MMLRLLLQPVAFLQFALLITGCAVSPTQTESLDYRARAETQVDGAIRVSAVVLSPQETQSTFPTPLAKKGIQPCLLYTSDAADEHRDV